MLVHDCLIYLMTPFTDSQLCLLLNLKNCNYRRLMSKFYILITLCCYNMLCHLWTSVYSCVLFILTAASILVIGCFLANLYSKRGCCAAASILAIDFFFAILHFKHGCCTAAIVLTIGCFFAILPSKRGCCA